MKTLYQYLIQGGALTKQQAKELLIEMTIGQFHPNEIASILTVYMMRKITLNELKGFREALMELCLTVDLSHYNTIDVCGTGGDGKNTFNISTLSAFVVAGAGFHVAKHGNYAVSSNSGSSNVLEQLGIRFSNREDYLSLCLDKANIAILHAPVFHPAMKSVAPIRKSLGVKTFFNILGPLVNPCNPTYQMVGVFNLELARLYTYFLQESLESFTIVHGLDGYDELSLLDQAKIITNKNQYIFDPKKQGFNSINPKDIHGGNSIKDAANIFTSILNANGSQTQNNIVCANAALAIMTIKNMEFDQAFNLAKEALLSKKALEKFKTLYSLCQNKITN